MAPRNLVTPALDAVIDVLVDWLELVAFFDEFDRARIDELIGNRQTQAETPAGDFGSDDVERDRVRETIENEVIARQKALGGAYPFDLSADGEELCLLASRDDKIASFYLALLITSHFTGSPILVDPPSDAMVSRMRNRVFQVIGTLAVAGLTRGSAVSVGYPRETKETILTVLRRAEEWGFGLAPRDKPGRHATPRAKDGGIDVIGWPSSDRPPPPYIMFGQLASGNNWRDKPLILEYDLFVSDFLEDAGTGQHNFLTMIPFQLSDELDFQRASVQHRYIADRRRAPRHAVQAFDLAAQGIEVDEIANVFQVTDWLSDYRSSVVANSTD